jgi:hypothetical protein
MTVEEARTIWLTMLGSDWVPFIDVLSDPHYFGSLDAAFLKLRKAEELHVDIKAERVKLKCKS